MKHLITILLCVFVFSCKAQPPMELTTTSKKAKKAYESALLYLDARQYDKAMGELKSAQEADPNFVEAYILQANVHMELREWEKAIEQFKKSFTINPSFFPASYADCGYCEMRTGKYAEAKADYETFLKVMRKSTPEKMINNAKTQIACCDFAIKAMANPVPFNPKTIGKGINSDACEYFPNVTADDQTFLITRNRQERDPNTGALMMTQEDFYISYRDDNGNWSTAQNMGGPLNSPRNEGAPSLSADGRFLFFAACDEDYMGYGPNRQGFGSCDIFFSQKHGGMWTPPVNVGAPINTGAWESQPSFSSDGKTLYFISSRKGGFGSSDIYMAELGPDSKWGPVMNLGADINTVGKEEAVFIHPDNQTLYFASDGLTGMGGLDLYVCRRQADGKWGKPENLGYPINTFNDESGLIVNGLGDIAYYSSNREGTMGCDDIWMFDLPKALRPTTVTFMQGKVFDKTTKKPIGAGFELIDLATGKTAIASTSDPVTGEFTVCIPVNADYALNVNSEGYCFYTESFRLKESTNPNQPYKMDVPLIPLTVGGGGELKNVYFETGKFDLRPESEVELNKLVAFLNANPTMKIELSGHTDNVGDKKANQVLSENRARAVYVYLVSHGVDAKRLSYKGYGDTQPKVANDTPEHRQMNRR
ncbi:MAG: OmpA family protein, partial [Bacteroidia bacterium]